ncbi:MAG: VanZ family protein [Nitrospirales bacterium]|nr:VanZ family protein [Nitrospirales bacterium]
MIVYGSLYPFQGWETADWRLPKWPHYFSKADVVTNLLVYIPLGFLVARMFSQRFRPVPILFVSMLGTGLSLALEWLQGGLPERVPSLVDVLLNGIGTMTGAALAVYGRIGLPWGERLRSLREEWILPGRLGGLGLLVLGLWVSSQLAPFVPSLDWGNIKQGLKPFWLAIHDLSRLSWLGVVDYALNLAALGVVAATVAREGKRILPLFWVYAMGVLLMKIPIMGRSLSLEALMGLSIGAVLCGVMVRLPRVMMLGIAGIALLAGFIIAGLQPDSVVTELRQFNWIPFRGQISSILGFVDIIEGIWPFVALAFLALSINSFRRVVLVYAGGTTIFLLVFVVEWLQQAIPGRSPDITDAMLAAAGWCVPLILIKRK